MPYQQYCIPSTASLELALGLCTWALAVTSICEGVGFTGVQVSQHVLLPGTQLSLLVQRLHLSPLTSQLQAGVAIH